MGGSIPDVRGMFNRVITGVLAPLACFEVAFTVLNLVVWSRHVPQSGVCEHVRLYLLAVACTWLCLAVIHACLTAIDQGCCKCLSHDLTVCCIVPGGTLVLMALLTLVALSAYGAWAVVVVATTTTTGTDGGCRDAAPTLWNTALANVVIHVFAFVVLPCCFGCYASRRTITRCIGRGVRTLTCGRCCERVGFEYEYMFEPNSLIHYQFAAAAAAAAPAAGPQEPPPPQPPLLLTPGTTRQANPRHTPDPNAHGLDGSGGEWRLPAAQPPPGAANYGSVDHDRVNGGGDLFRDRDDPNPRAVLAVVVAVRVDDGDGGTGAAPPGGAVTQ